MSVRPVVASFAGGEPVRRALGQLHAAGFERDDISLLMAENNGHTPRFGLMAGRKWAAGAAYGAALGGLVGGVVGGLMAFLDVAGAATLSLTFATLAGVGLGGGVGGSLGAALGLRSPEYRAKLVDSSQRAGHVMIAVWAPDSARADRVARILAR